MLSRPFRRLASTAVSPRHKQLVEDFFYTASSVPSIVRKQFLDPNQIQRLSLTLNRPRLYRVGQILENEIPLNGTPLAPGYHLVYFTPAALPDHLGRDGTDISYSPAEPFTRRMWAGGRIDWVKENPLRIGDEAIETTKLVFAKPKVTRAGEEIVVVGVKKTFENAKGLALFDRRDWVFRTQLSGLPPSHDYSESTGSDDAPLPLPDTSQKSRDYLQTAVSLFRFSALTFNAHKIHYSRPWCRDVEGHRDIVVHGPLNLINMLDFWRDEQADDFMIPQSISYRATAPFYAGEKYRALLERETDTTSIKLWGHNGKGDVKVGMLGDVVD
ncbi:hypothetical protein HO133_008634 [Letharia lupina]|uniref:Mesaconyl-C4 CoA hydratase n=1 Tax=Letharia lupina TaxID=560253 RepID=A0A8H6CPC0_9LECA|nr:uncharacterized protein HO133_008634 [Letharia lupina]KAF6227192.1 hypothetical protein HO133_008634 [Letharia lupina]